MGMGLEHRMQERRLGRACLFALIVAFGLLFLQAGSSIVSAASADADLAITNSDSPDPVTAGAPLTYTVRVVNAGPDPAADVVVVNDLAKGVGFVSAQSTQGACGLSANGRKVTCTLGTVAVMVGPQYNPTPVTITIAALAPTGVGAKGRTISNRATVDSDTKDPKRGNDRATATTRVVEAPPLTCGGRPVTVLGTGGPDLLLGTAGDDVIFAGLGADRIFSFGGADTICAGPDADVVGSGGGHDTANGGAGADRLFGRSGADVLRGGRGRDRIRGGSGPDLLAGGLGLDRCFGGPGVDTFRSCR
jgi:uncharacterized repeat protein (TIGR01451 family)